MYILVLAAHALLFRHGPADGMPQALVLGLAHALLGGVVPAVAGARGQRLAVSLLLFAVLESVVVATGMCVQGFWVAVLALVDVPTTLIVMLVLRAFLRARREGGQALGALAC